MKKSMNNIEAFRIMFYRIYGTENYGNAGCGGPVLAIFLLVAFLFCGCKSIQYVPVETVKTEYIHNTDTVIKTDSVKSEKETVIREARPEDSVMIAKLGIKLQDNERLLILLQKELSDARCEVYESHTDTVIKTDSIQVPYPVEKQLGRFQQFCLDFGKIMIGGSIAAILFAVFCIIMWIRKMK